MKRADLLLAALALAAGLTLGACFGSSCLDPATLDYALSTTTYETEASGVGDYVPDGDAVTVRVDAAAETVTLSFTEDGRPVVVRYDVVSVDLPE